MPSTLDIVIVNWNGGDLVRQCLQTVAPALAAVEGGGRVIIVDNASTDGSADELEALPAAPRVIRNTENRGFGAACNQGAAGSAADFLLFLNPDTRLYPDSLTVPLAALTEPGLADVGLLGIQLLDPDGQISRTSARFPTPGRLAGQCLGLDRFWPRLCPPHFMVEFDHRTSREVDQPIGAFLLLRRSLFEELGGFDERFFVYFEDVDLALRSRLLGRRNFFLAEARAVHVGGGTTGQIRARRLFYLLRSRIRYGFKHFDAKSAVLVALATLFLEPLTRAAHAVLRRRPAEVGAVVAGTGLLWGDLLRRALSGSSSRPSPAP